jgi:hypothetical protein
MKTKTQMSKLVAGAAIVLAANVPGYGQTNLGSACGCPPVSARTTVTVSSLPGFTTVANAFGGELTQGGNWTCDKTYILDQKIYVPAGQVLNIQPGTVVKGVFTSSVQAAAALIIERGGKIIAAGTKECPIVFTTVNDVNVDGTYGVINRGQWGGIVILGKATNNLNYALNGPFTPGSGNGKLAVCDGVGVIEGFATNVPQDRFGVCTSANAQGSGEAVSQTFDDNDNSGIMRYVSIRHSGAVLSVGNEINGLTLGSVGRGTTLENIEIVSCADDNIEFFGGTVNAKYVTTLFGNDDMFDWDDGYTGKLQFLFGMKGDMTTGWSPDNDNGFEADGDDQKTCALPISHPVVYNATIIGNAKSVVVPDQSSIAGINAKELTEGEIYNSIFANFKNGLNMIQSVGTRTACSIETYNNWINGSLKVKCNTFVGCTNPLTIANATTALIASDNTKFVTTDLNNIVSSLPGFTFTFTANPNNNTWTAKNDVVPNPALSNSGCPAYPVDGFFTTVAYRGAFASTGASWLSDWSYSALIGSTLGTAPCATDLNKDGVTNVTDFLIFLPAFNTTCQ